VDGGRPTVTVVVVFAVGRFSLMEARTILFLLPAQNKTPKFLYHGPKSGSFASAGVQITGGSTAAISAQRLSPLLSIHRSIGKKGK